ncbi:MAG: glucokinase, partial [Siculibacillus sp.]|nr:glucokinase [Siculibacillus sp.]
LETTPRTAILAIAAPIEGDRVRFTNSPWVLEPRGLITELGFRDVVVVNDFEAQGLALPSLGDGDVVTIGGGVAHAEATKLVVGPGTGLGVGVLVHSRGLWIPVPGEGGHVTFAPRGARERAIVDLLAQDLGRVSAEHVLNGAGLVRLHRAIRLLDDGPIEVLGPADVTAAALAGEPTAVEVMEFFATALGRFAGDMALVCLPHGGVHIAGGIPPRVLPFLTDGRFRAAFEDKAPHRATVAGLATRVIVHPVPAFLGLAAYASRPDLYAVDLDGRRWRA